MKILEKFLFYLSDTFENLMTIGLKNLLTIVEKNGNANWQQHAL